MTELRDVIGEGVVLQHIPTGRLYVVTSVGRTMVSCYAYKQIQGPERKKETVTGKFGRPYKLTDMKEAIYDECVEQGLIDD